MTDYEWTLRFNERDHKGYLRRRDVNFDYDDILGPISDRVILGKTTWALGGYGPGQGARTPLYYDYRGELFDRMHPGQRINSLAVPEHPRSVVRFGERVRRVKRLRNGVEIPKRYFTNTETDHARISYDVHKCDGSVTDEIAALVAAQVPPRRDLGHVDQVFDEMQRLWHRRVAPMKEETVAATEMLRTEIYARICEFAEIETDSDWTLTHRPSGLMVKSTVFSRTRSQAWFSYSRDAVMLGTSDVIEMEKLLPPSLDVFPYSVRKDPEMEDEGDEFTGWRTERYAGGGTQMVYYEKGEISELGEIDGD